MLKTLKCICQSNKMLIFVAQKQIKKEIMETTMTIAIETYANLTNRTFKEVAEQMQTNELVQESIMKLMFCVA